MQRTSFFLSQKTTFFTILIAILFSSCYTVSESESIGFANFSFNNVSNTNGRTESADPSFLIVTLVNESGLATLSSETIALYNFNGALITESVTLPVGNYTLTEYSVLDAAMNIIYSTPLDGSELAYLVDVALPIEVSVSANTTTKINPQVLSTSGLTPEAFGYTSFSFNIAETVEFLASALVFNSDPLILNWQLTDATVEISNGGEILYSGALEALTNHIIIPGGYDSYDIKISKSGFVPKTATYTMNELQAFFLTPLTVRLEEI